MGKHTRGTYILLAGFPVLAALLSWLTLFNWQTASGQIDAATLATDVRAGRIARIVTLPGSDEAMLYYRERDESLAVRLPNNVGVDDLLRAYDIDPAAVDIQAKPTPPWADTLAMLTSLLPLLLGVGLVGWAGYVVAMLLRSRENSP